MTARRESEKPIWTDKNTNSYVFIGPDYTPPQGSPAKGPPVNEQVMKSAVALPWPAYLKPRSLGYYALAPVGV